MNRLSRYVLATIVVACLLALILGFFPRIELKSEHEHKGDQNLGLEHEVETLERSTDLTADEVYDLYVGPEAPQFEKKRPPSEIDFPILILTDPKPKVTVSTPSKQPLVRIPPTFPPRFSQGNHSGYCTVRFDVSPQGQPINIETPICTSDLLKEPTIKFVQKWKYRPKIKEGQPVERLGIETKIRFDLQEENGILLPLPEGY